MSSTAGSGVGNPALGIKGLPDAAKQKTTAGAIAFVKFYVDVINTAYQESRPGILEPLALSSCKTCDLWEQSVVTYSGKGQRADGPIYRNGGFYVAADLLANTPASVHVGAKFASTIVRLVDAEGTVVKTESASEPKMVFPVVWTSSGWRIEKAQSGSA